MSHKKISTITLGFLAVFLSNQASNLFAMHSLQELSFQSIISTIFSSKLDKEIPFSLRDENFNNGLDAFVNFNRPNSVTNLQSFFPIFSKNIQVHHFAGEASLYNLDRSDMIHAIIQLQGGRLKNCLVTACHKNAIQIWDPLTGIFIKSLTGHTEQVIAVIEIFHEGHRYIASASLDNSIKIWDPASGDCVRTLTIKKPLVLLQLNNGKIAVSSGKIIKILDIATNQCSAEFYGHTDIITSIIQLDNNNLLASASYDNTVKIWDLNKKQCIQSLDDKDPIIKNRLLSVIQLYDGNIAAVSSDRSIKIWDYFSGLCICRLEGHDSFVTSLIQLKNRNLASGDQDGVIKIWDLSKLKRNKCIHTSNLGVDGITTLLQMNNGNIVAGSWDRSIKILDLYPPDIQDLSLMQYHLISSLENFLTKNRTTTLHSDWLKIFQSLPEHYQIMFNEIIQIPSEDLFCFGSKRKERHDDDDFPFPDNKKFEQY